MAGTAAGARLTQRHRDGQTVVRALLYQQLLQLWPLLDPTRPVDATRQWVELVVDLILSFRAVSVERAVQYYRDFKLVEHGDDVFDLRNLAYYTGLDQPDRDLFRRSVGYTGPSRMLWRINKGMDHDEAARLALVELSGAASRHVNNGGRDITTRMVRDDDDAVGFFRVTGPRPCAFCAMLASRGPVYESRSTAARTTASAPSRPPGTKYHDNCQCSAEPAFSRFAEWPEENRAYDRLWRDTVGDRSGKAALNAFRTALRHQRQADTGDPTAVA